jgi:hypothetical protein
MLGDLGMRVTGAFVLAVVLLLADAPANASEEGVVLRAGELKAQPFIDAATTDNLAANQPVSIISRQGAWVQVASNGKTGWVRMLNIRMGTVAAAGEKAKPKKNAAGPPSLLRTGSSGKTVTTGVKGLDEEDIRKAAVDKAQLDELKTLAVEPAEADADARQAGLKESSVEYFKKGERK